MQEFVDFAKNLRKAMEMFYHYLPHAWPAPA
jgi:hypothetical protein